MPGVSLLPELNPAEDAPQSGPRDLLETWLDARIAEMRTIFARPASATTKADPAAILALLQHHEFNYQSKGKTAHLAPALLETFAGLIAADRPLPIYFLYHGGYRTDVRGGALAHTFAPDQTELMLLWQVARLKARLDLIHAPGLRFAIVINNGVAFHTNGIPYDRTNAYVAHLRRMIERLGAQDHVQVLNQAELGDFSAHMARVEVLPKATITEAEHGIVERFLGRRCSLEEASLKIATYERAEAVWGAEVRAIVAEAGGFFCRQIGHPACLSFRPFPGGAIRVQNGAVTFRLEGGTVKPAFVTPLTWDRETPRGLPLRLSLFDGIHPVPFPAEEKARRSA